MALNKAVLAASVLAVAAAPFGIGSTSGDAAVVSGIRPHSASPPMSESGSGSPLVPRGDLLEIKRGRFRVLNRRGRVVRELGRFQASGALQAMAISGDRRHAFISILHGEEASPEVDDVDLATGSVVRIGDGVSPAVSPSDGRLAYVATTTTGDRTALVVQVGSDPPHQIPMGTSAFVGTPPGLITNWSPDGSRIAVYDDTSLRLVDPATATSVSSQPAVPGRFLTSPAFLSTERLVGLANCCVGPQRLAVVNLTTGKRKPFGALRAPPENMGRVGHGVIFAVTALRQLVLIRKGKVQIIASGVAVAAA